MLIKAILITCLLVPTAFSRTPVGMQKWQNDDTTYTIQFGGAPHNYPESTGWQPIENDFVLDAGSYKAINALLKTTVSPTGDVIVTFTHNSNDYTVTERLHSLKFFRKSDSAWINIDATPDWSNISQNSNVVKWAGVFPGIDYRVRKERGRVENGIFFKPAFLDSAVALYNQRSDSADIYLANVMVYTLTDNIDGHDIPLGNIRKRVLKRFGNTIFQIHKQRLRYPGFDSPPEVPIWQRHIFVNDQLYVLEFVKMSDIKRIHEQYPTATIWHNLDFTLNNSTDIEDANIKGNGPDGNFGNINPFTTYQASSFNWAVLYRASNVHDSLGAGATISYAACSVFVSSHTTDGNTVAYGMWKTAWVEEDTGSGEGGVTYNDWESPDNEWGTEGVLCANDGGSFNSVDNGACTAARADRMATAASTVNITGTGWHGWTFSTWAQTCYDASMPMSLRLQKEGANDAENLRSTDSGSTPPFFVFTYTTAAAGTAAQVINVGGG